MSWSRRSLLIAAGASAFATAGCFRPLYGPTASGVPLQESLAAIDVLVVGTKDGQERLGHYIRSELIFNLDGSGRTSQKKYKLTLDASEAVQVITTETTSGRADGAILSVTCRYVLTAIDGNRIVAQGTARTTANYLRDAQRFANIRAARDAEIRASGVIAEEIKQRLAAVFATSG